MVWNVIYEEEEEYLMVMGKMASKVDDPIEVANAMGLEEFVREFLPEFDCGR